MKPFDSAAGPCVTNVTFSLSAGVLPCALLNDMPPNDELVLLFLYSKDSLSSLSMTRVIPDVCRAFGDRLRWRSMEIHSPDAKPFAGTLTEEPVLLLLRGNRELWRGTGLLHSTEVITAIEHASRCTPG